VNVAVGLASQGAVMDRLASIEARIARLEAASKEVVPGGR
jgi:hypothetical protein